MNLCVVLIDPFIVFVYAGHVLLHVDLHNTFQNRFGNVLHLLIQETKVHPVADQRCTLRDDLLGGQNNVYINPFAEGLQFHYLLHSVSKDLLSLVLLFALYLWVQRYAILVA
jgi:hypothetical protein